MQLKDQVLGQILFIPPNDPAHSSVNQAKFVTTCVDGLYSRALKIPFVSISFGMRERGNETATGRVHVDGNVNSGFLLIFVQNIIDLPYRLVVTFTQSEAVRTGQTFPLTCISAAQNDEYSYGILVNVLFDQFWVQPIVALAAHGQYP